MQVMIFMINYKASFQIWHVLS